MKLHCFFCFFHVVARVLARSNLLFNGIHCSMRGIHLSGDCFPQLAMTLSVSSIPFSKCFQFHDTCLIAYSPGDDLSSVFTIVCFDDRPAAVCAIVTSPLEMMKIPRGMDFL